METWEPAPTHDVAGERPASPSPTPPAWTDLRPLARALLAAALEAGMTHLPFRPDHGVVDACPAIPLLGGSRPMRCVIYLRVSTKEQADKGLSIPAQRQACVRHVRDQGWELIDEYSDRGESARTADRPQLQALLARLQHDGDIDAVVVHKLDRLARNMEDHVAIRALLRRRGGGAGLDHRERGGDGVGTAGGGHPCADGRVLLGQPGRRGPQGHGREGQAGRLAASGTIGYLNKRASVGGRRVAYIVPDPTGPPWSAVPSSCMPPAATAWRSSPMS
jgi:Resolvase, N terminal domain